MQKQNKNIIKNIIILLLLAMCLIMAGALQHEELAQREKIQRVAPCIISKQNVGVTCGL